MFPQDSLKQFVSNKAAICGNAVELKATEDKAMAIFHAAQQGLAPRALKTFLVRRNSPTTQQHSR